uniref:Uncharacterized protein n=1 Tax=Bionectria ochroleuca TaxID=29856 RepID=A0A8H7NJR2_BIOOC
MIPSVVWRQTFLLFNCPSLHFTALQCCFDLPSTTNQRIQSADSKPSIDNGHYESHHHPGAAPTHGGPGDDVRQAQVFTGYANQGYPTNGHGGSMSHMAPHSSSIIPAKRHSRSGAEDHDDLFPDIPEAKKRKFILVEDNVRGSRLRVRVTLEGVDTNEIPDSFRKGASVFPRTYFPREMQSPPQAPQAPTSSLTIWRMTTHKRPRVGR